MPSLNWIGKDKVINYHQKVPYRVLERQYSFDVNGQFEEDNGSKNMIIHGDNLEALKSLLPHYEGRVKCIYIDPPYNTGNENWVYNDNVNDPRIRKWLGEVVGPVGEDLSRHDKWLCMMYPRLKLLQKLLSNDGAIFISIDDNEQTNLKLICEEIFGSNNYVATVTVIVKPEGRRYGFFAKTHESLLIFAKDYNFLSLNEIEVEGANYEFYDSKGGFNLKGLRNRNVRAFNAQNRPNLRYPFYVDISSPDENKLCKVYTTPQANCTEVWASTIDGKQSVWRWGKEKATVQQKDLVAYRGNDHKIRIFQKERKLTQTAKTVWFNKNFYSNIGTKEISEILGKSIFDFPKPLNLIEQILGIGCDNNSIVLDSFAGSGTTAHAVLDMNKKDGGDRKFILVEMGNYADGITAERVKRVIDGYSSDRKDIVFDKKITASNLVNGPEIVNEAKAAAAEAKDKYDAVSRPKMINGDLQVIGTKKASRKVDGTGGSFSYYELGEPLLLENHMLNENVSTDKIREYVFYMETHQMIGATSANEPFLLGIKDGTAYYFYYVKQKVTSLNYAFLKTIKSKSADRIIYADCCLLSEEELQRFSITFKKIPRDISRL